MKSSLLAVLLVGLVAAVSGQDCNKTADFILDEGYIIAQAMAPVATKAFGKKNWTGTVFLPSNSAMIKLQNTLLQAAELDAFPEGYNWTTVFQIPGLSEVLLYHLVPTRIDPSRVKSSRTLGPFKTQLSRLKNATFCDNADGRLKVRVNVTGKNYTAYVLDASDPENPAKVTGNQTVCEGSVMLIDRVLLPCANSTTLTALLATLKQLGAAAAPTASPSGSGTNRTSGNVSSPSPAPSSAPIAAQSLVALLACSLALLAVVFGV